MVLSDKSCGIEEAFTQDVMNKREFQYQKKAKKREGKLKEKQMEEFMRLRMEKETNLKKQLPSDEEENYEEIEYQVRKTGEWGYKKVKEKVKKNQNRESLLDMRVKKKSDKFCWV